jgi:hypothetical protein
LGYFKDELATRGAGSKLPCSRCIASSENTLSVQSLPLYDRAASDNCDQA